MCLCTAMASASFSSDMLSEAIQKNKREKAAKKIRKRKENGWDDIHEEIENLPYCEIQGKLTKAFLCIKCSNCLITGQCVACYEKEKKIHTLIDREEIWKLEEKGLVKIWQ